MGTQESPDKKAYPSEFKLRAAEYAIQRLLDRFYYITLMMSGLFAVYGFVSLDFIRSFRPEVTLVQNVWPRIVFNTIPLLFLALFTRRSAVANTKKVFIWLVCFCAIFDLACMVQVWPIALSGHARIMLYVNAANNSVFFAIGMILALSLREVLYAAGIVAGIFWAPLFYVVYKAGDPLVLKTIVNDTLFLGATGFLFGRGMTKAEYRLAELEIEREIEASKFLGPVVSKAIYHDDKEALKRRRVRGFVISMDIRDSTVWQQRDPERWLKFRKEYFALVAQAADACGGFIQKTMGDGHLVNFGILDAEADLAGIPGIETEEKRAEERRLKHFSDKSYSFLETVFQGFQRLSESHFPGELIRMGAGIDKGYVETGLQGDGSHLELDVNGDAVNCSSRLQEYCKLIGEKLDPRASMLIVSPFAADYLDDLSVFQRLPTNELPVRNYPGIKWVLVRKYAAGSLSGTRVA